MRREFMTPKERFMKILSFEQPDRIPLMDFGYWKETIDLWHKQGLPKEVSSTEEVEKYFGLDRGFETNLINYWGDNGPIGILWREYPVFSKEIISETDTTVTFGGEVGLIIENKYTGSIPFQEKYPVESPEEFRKKITSKRFNARDEGRITPEFPGMLKRAKEEELPIGLWIDGFLAWPRELVGIENLAYLYYDDPDFVHAMQKQHIEFIKDYVKMALEKTTLDYACVFEDMCYKNGCLISPQTFNDFMKPYYLEMIDFLHQQGIKKILVDSDGNSVQLTDWLVDVGVDGHYPLEINSGALPEVIRERHPNLVLIGGVDKRQLEMGKGEIDKELDKLPPLLEKGGFIPALDHRVHPQVPMANYQYYLERKRKILEKYGAVL